MDRLARLRLGAETFQASSGKSHRPAQLAPRRCHVAARCRERGLNGKPKGLVSRGWSKGVGSSSTGASCVGSIPQLPCASPKSAERNGRKPPRTRLNWSRTHAGERARTPWHDASGCTLRTERHGHPLNLRRNRFVASCKLELVVARNLNRLPAAFCARHPRSGFFSETPVVASSSLGTPGEQEALKLPPHALET